MRARENFAEMKKRKEISKASAVAKPVALDPKAPATPAPDKVVPSMERVVAQISALQAEVMAYLREQKARDLDAKAVPVRCFR